MASGSSVNVGRVTTSWHVGTHADAPLHVALGGAPSESLPLAAFDGPATVIDAREVPTGMAITQEWLAEALRGHAKPQRLLVHTGRTVAAGAFPDGWPALNREAAAWLAATGVTLLGVDAPSVDLRTATDLAVHKALFSGGAWVLENLDLRQVPPGRYHLRALPVLVTGADAAPVRAVLDPLEP